MTPAEAAVRIADLECHKVRLIADTAHQTYARHVEAADALPPGALQAARLAFHLAVLDVQIAEVRLLAATRQPQSERKGEVISKKKTVASVLKDTQHRLDRAANLARIHATGTCDPACRDTIVAALDVQRQNLIDALAQNMAAEIACLDCCQPSPEPPPPPPEGA